MPKVLVVADTPWVVNEVRSSLSIGDWEIDELSEPSRAALLAADVDAVVIDMQIGNMGGMAVIRDIRQASHPAGRPRLVLLLDRSADSFLAGRAGADASLAKPINAWELRRALAPSALSEEE